MDKEELVKNVESHCNESAGCIGCGYYKKPKGCKTRLAYDILQKAGCLKEEIKLPVVKTGVLMSPAEIVDCKTVGEIKLGYGILNTPVTLGCFCKDIIGKRIVVNSYRFPISFYKNIEDTVDYSQIPEGSIVEVVTKDHNIPRAIVIDRYKNNNIYYYAFVDDERYFSYSDIVSLKIIRWGKDGK